MSLFPAYVDCKSESSDSSDHQESAGTSCPSFSSFVLPDKRLEENVISSSEEIIDEEPKKKRLKHKKKHKGNKKSKSFVKDDASSSALFYEDSSVHSDKINPTVPQVTLSKPISGKRSSGTNKKKKKKKKSNKFRYYLNKIGEENEEKISSLNPEPMEIQQFLKCTEEFNQKLREDPKNVDMWLAYVKLQDSGEGSVRGRGEKKLSILDRALELNPGSEKLFQQKMLITEAIFPLDKVALEAKTMVSKFPKNIVAWQWLINGAQFNLSKMTAPGVLLAYEAALNGIQKAYHDSRPFLDVLVECGLFLRQAGHWEQLWTLMELYLELCLTTTGSRSFRINIVLPEEEIQQLEDSVITSGLPLGALWLRVEHLREAVYFLPAASDDPPPPDPQRTVFREDLTPLLFPLTPSSYPHLVLATLLLFKVPPLPLTHEFYRYTSLGDIPWSFDAVELLLSAQFFHDGVKVPYIDEMRELLVGPQYIVDKFGQNQFFFFVNSLFDKCIEHNSDVRVCFIVWQLRWWRWICSLQNSEKQEGGIKDPKCFRSKAKKHLKQYRDAIPLYTEFALLEKEVGNFEGALKVLETAIQLRDPPLTLGSSEKRDMLCLYNTYGEMLIKDDLEKHKQKVLSLLIGLSFGEPVDKVVPTPELIQRASARMTHLTTEAVREALDCGGGGGPPTLSDLMFPHPSVCWMSAQAWFLYLTEDVWQAALPLEEAIKQFESHLDEKTPNMLNVILEGTYQTLVNMVSHFAFNNPGHFLVLHEILIRALKIFPNSVYFMYIAGASKLSGLKWQSLSSGMVSCGSSLGAVHMFIISHTRLKNESRPKGGGISPRLDNLLGRLSSDQVCQRCPLVWRLLIQASAHREREQIKGRFYRAIEKCPWVKSLYYEASKVLPEDLSEVQDLLVEKELRLHITPEELEILREG